MPRFATDTFTTARDFSPAGLPAVPDLAGLQKQSFQRLQTNLKRALEEAFSGQPSLALEACELEAPGDDRGDCERFGRSYAGTLRVRWRRKTRTTPSATWPGWKQQSWMSVSPSMRRLRFRRVYRKPDKLPTDSPTRLALAGKTPPDGEYFRGGTLASIWFPYVRAGDALDVFLVEEAIPLGRHGVLSLLYPNRDWPGPPR